VPTSGTLHDRAGPEETAVTLRRGRTSSVD
jgi:hypothetical protein